MVDTKTTIVREEANGSSEKLLTKIQKGIVVENYGSLGQYPSVKVSGKYGYVLSSNLVRHMAYSDIHTDRCECR